MEEKDKIKLQNILDLAEDNNRMLKKMERRHLYSVMGRFVYVALILTMIFISYYYLQPYINKIIDMYGTATKQLEKIQNTADTVSRYIPSVK